MNAETGTNRVRICVKYCGGCNSLYDRAKRVRRFISENSEYEYVSADTPCDYATIVCGCPKKCADCAGIYPKRERVYLCGEPDFIAFEKKLKEKQSITCEAKKIAVGDEVSVTVKYSQSDADNFCKATGDTNYIHFEAENACEGHMPRPVIPGALLLARLSAIMGSRLPGPGTILTESSARFIRPAYADEELTFTISFKECFEDKDAYMGVFLGKVADTSGKRLLTASFGQKMSRNLFKVEN